MMQLETNSSLLRLANFFPALSVAEEQELARSGRNGSSDAQERIILCNLRLVVTIARDYLGLGLPLEDLVSEGTTGLMKAVDKFDPDNGARFGTYATWWIRHAILRALCNQARLIRLPAHAVARMARIRQVFARMTEQLGREPTQEEIADEAFSTALLELYQPDLGPLVPPRFENMPEPEKYTLFPIFFPATETVQDSGKKSETWWP